MGSLQSSISTLEIALKDLRASYDSGSVERRLEGLMPALNSANGNRAQYAEAGRLSKALNEYRMLEEKVEGAVEYAKLADEIGSKNDHESAVDEIEDLLPQARNFILRQKFTGKYDQNNAIISMQNGRWIGVEWFIEKLENAFAGFAKKQGLRVTYLDSLNQSEVTLKIEGENAYAFFRGEHGVHRVVYTDDDGKKHKN